VQNNSRFIDQVDEVAVKIRKTIATVIAKVQMMETKIISIVKGETLKTM
jgi:hypothetical protein